MKMADATSQTENADIKKSADGIQKYKKQNRP
jgi:hypothetical protein